jgi:hypothetical protein
MHRPCFTLRDPDDALEAIHRLRTAWPEATAAAMVAGADGRLLVNIPFLGSCRTGPELVEVAEICSVLLEPGPACLVLCSFCWPAPGGTGRAWRQAVRVWHRMEQRCRVRGVLLLDWLILDAEAALSFAELCGGNVPRLPLKSPR